MSQSKNNTSGLELKRQPGVYYLAAWLVKHKVCRSCRNIKPTASNVGAVIADDASLYGDLCDKLGRGSKIRTLHCSSRCCGSSGARKVLSSWGLLLGKGQRMGQAASGPLVSDDLSCFTAVTIGGCQHKLHVICATTAAPKCLVFSAFMPCWVT